MYFFSLGKKQMFVEEQENKQSKKTKSFYQAIALFAQRNHRWNRDFVAEMEGTWAMTLYKIYMNANKQGLLAIIRIVVTKSNKFLINEKRTTFWMIQGTQHKSIP